jgi:hypothetical protein
MEAQPDFTAEGAESAEVKTGFVMAIRRHENKEAKP